MTILDEVVSYAVVHQVRVVVAQRQANFVDEFVELDGVRQLEQHCLGRTVIGLNRMAERKLRLNRNGDRLTKIMVEMGVMAVGNYLLDWYAPLVA